MAQEQVSDTSYKVLEELTAVVGVPSPSQRDPGTPAAQKLGNLDSTKDDKEQKTKQHLSVEDKDNDEEKTASTDIECGGDSRPMRSFSSKKSIPKIIPALTRSRRYTAATQIDLSGCCKGVCQGISVMFGIAVSTLKCLAVLVALLVSPISIVVSTILFWKMTVAYGSLDGSEECGSTATLFYWIAAVGFAIGWANIFAVFAMVRAKGQNYEVGKEP
ncbi:MAG: hypothetical protein SGILL_007620, partial [Bacillariaceae sp.]